MTFNCEQCEKARKQFKKGRKSPPRSTRSTPSSRGSGSSSRSSGCLPKRKCPDKPVYVAADPADQTCIMVESNQPGGSSCSGSGNGPAGGGGGRGISFQFPGSSKELKLWMPGPESGPKDSNCIQIMGNSIVKTTSGGLQIIPCKAKGGGGNGGVQISLPRSAGGGSSCGTGDQSDRGNMQLSISKTKGGQPLIDCEPGGKGMEITYGGDKKKLNVNHYKDTVASMINKR
ncbi:hypothetical protein M758_4G245800 [Ceratodon purpureus]|nr:hypothetical protein M758_4G245800 [Ceratodon purpureus]